MKIKFTEIARLEYLDAIDYYNSRRNGLGYEFSIEIDKDYIRGEVSPSLHPRSFTGEYL